MLWALLTGCAYTLQAHSTPQPVIVELPGGERVTTPGPIKLRLAPFQRQRVRITATGYRPLDIDLRDRHITFGRWLKRPFRRVKGEVEFILVPTHGAVGTWSEDDVPQ